MAITFVWKVLGKKVIPFLKTIWKELSKKYKNFMISSKNDWENRFWSWQPYLQNKGKKLNGNALLSCDNDKVKIYIFMI